MELLQNITVDKKRIKPFDQLEVTITFDGKTNRVLTAGNCEDSLEELSRFVLSSLGLVSDNYLAFFSSNGYFAKIEEPSKVFYIELGEWIDWEMISQESSAYTAKMISDRYAKFKEAIVKHFPEINDRVTYSL